MTISLSDKQNAAIATIKDWYSNRSKDQQVCRVFGYAGVGKSTIVKYAIDELGLSTEKPGEVLYAAFTGKAALVMTRKGTPASTIHSLVYRVSEPTPQEIEKLEKEAAEIRAGLQARGVAERLFEEARLRSLELRLKDAHKPRFVLNAESAVRDCKLLVLDEVSMVGAEMARDLLAFGKPTLVLGDPGQLPPVKGEGAFDAPNPDVMLTEVHRQAGESAVLRLATLAREGKWIPHGHHDDFVWKMRRNDVGPEQLLKADQVICGRNATRIQLNVAMKRAAGFDAVFPGGNGEKLICLKNRNDVGLVNGMFVTLDDIKDDGDDIAFTASITSEDGKKIGGGATGKGERFRIWRGPFLDHVMPDPERERREYQKKRTAVECVWGWAITCHKSQGSSWPNIVIYDDGLGRTAEDRARWLYTAITRAERGLVLLD
ncbi:ATP-dependent DNA helicase [Rhodoplanes roseus]|uniref:Exodeoxyribonuclease V n=1 Tax=Rhodoplanes roseus TaxID=29409 RepID=A0A327L5D5_9BRAD|nr:AAA family ATPase [Rhodoplanes roseus]RAI46169.1 exodeoxyribonuclease V [Rhodoplanes roseus]